MFDTSFSKKFVTKQLELTKKKIAGKNKRAFYDVGLIIQKF